MSELRPMYVVGPPGPLRERLERTMNAPVRVFEDVRSFLRKTRSEPGTEPGPVLFLADLSAEEVLRATEALGSSDGAWVLCLVREEGGEAVVRTLSVGWAEELDAVEAFRGGDDDRLLELRRIVRRMARTRHDINNPLTSGLAETQLLLMDVSQGELREALELIQRQLRRIRDLVQETQGIRPG